jgi:hypothetical protein
MTGSPTRLRDRACQLAPTDTDQSLAVARQIADPWFRCQAVAWSARYAPQPRVAPLAREAVSAAAGAPDPYIAVGASAWPLRALIERGEAAPVDAIVRRLLAVGETIDHPVRRLSALDLLFHAVYPLGGRAKRDALAALVLACQAAKSWRAGRTLVDAALVLAADDPDAAARSAAATLPGGRHRRQVERRLAAGEQRSVRAFFR